MSNVDNGTTYTLAGKPTIRMGLGLMGLTAGRDEPVSDQVAFEVIKKSLDAGANLLNTAMFYGGHSDPLSNLKLLGRFFAQYPEYRDKAIVSVKGGMIGKFSECTGDYDHLKKEILVAKDLLQGKEIDIFAPARLPDDRPLEETIANLLKLQKEGLFRTIGLSEVSHQSLRRAYQLSNGQISSNEIEVSLQTLGDAELVETVRTCSELGIKVIGYSPFGHGFLSGTLKDLSGIGKTDWRNILPRLSDKDNFETNLVLVNEIQELARRQGKERSMPELILGSLLRFDECIIPLPGSIDPKKAAQNAKAANTQLTDEEMKEVMQIVERNPVQGSRYPEVGMGSVVSLSHIFASALTNQVRAIVLDANFMTCFPVRDR
ncbi:uncharacterized protein I303_104196 [Kwoniella dejecticola CBS 10117]|uniref:NADP-dependent oxidoreductase domain-containing protein n=1 Tax=Kwoniella dejecticola CBS 10117 TaxID=1296121 RepID=A0A1A6A602_9TREE|nr:uncharacterized protein I303_04828 [Kwoniella dejecticola CBS 10117]OBR85492.1 hypothetical protein I303_04828 [Kwoniella dejecticola CBS 10117]